MDESSWTWPWLATEDSEQHSLHASELRELGKIFRPARHFPKLCPKHASEQRQKLFQNCPKPKVKRGKHGWKAEMNQTDP